MNYFPYVNTITNIDFWNINPSISCKNASEMASANIVCCIYLLTLAYLRIETNSVSPDHIAPKEQTDMSLNCLNKRLLYFPQQSIKAE